MICNLYNRVCYILLFPYFAKQANKSDNRTQEEFNADRYNRPIIVSMR